MSEWKEYKLGEIAEITSSKRIFYSEYVSKGIPFYRSKEIIDKYNNREIQTELYISELRYNEIKSKFGVPIKGDILLTSVGTLGIPYLLKDNEPFYFKDGNLTWIRNTVNNLIDVNFLYTWLKSNIGKQRLDEVVIGSTQPALTINGLKTIDILLPPLSEQRAIASVLSSLDDKIDLLHRQNTTLEKMAETLFRQWFVEEAKEEWEETILDTVISIKGGTTPSTKESKFWDGDIYWTTPRDLSNQSTVFLFDTERKITQKGLEQIGSGLLPVGTVLLSSRAPIGYLVITEIPVAINQGYIAIICDKEVSNNFMYLWCKHNMEEIKNAGNGSVFQEISKSVFRKLCITLPPIEVLKRFDKTIEPSFNKIKANQIQIHTLTTLRDTLLPKLMSGEVKIKEQ
ncbi:EcoKI restriction-modification system protein HsdS [Bacteroidales bacterium Barb6]|nr:EcoKI restriction-modification system protein HsdS [Bacteroidales bacterium Barb6]